MAFRIFYFPTDEFYDAVPVTLVDEAIEAGGIDVTAKNGAIAAYEAQAEELALAA